MILFSNSETFPGIPAFLINFWMFLDHSTPTAREISRDYDAERNKKPESWRAL